MIPTKAKLNKIFFVKYVFENIVYHLCSAHVQHQSLTVKLCSTVTDLWYMYFVKIKYTKDLIEDLTEAKKVVTKQSKPYKAIELVHRYMHRC